MEQKGLYLGTEISGKWWRRYTKDHLLMRGNGTYYYDDKGFYFLRALTKEPIFIPFNMMTRIDLGKWHSGRWAYGILIVKIIWVKENLSLSSGFIVSRSNQDASRLKEELESKIAG